MKYAIDRLEGDIAILENIVTKEKKEVPLSLLPANIYEKAIIREENNNYYQDIQTEKEREAMLREKLNRLKNLKKN